MDMIQYVEYVQITEQTIVLKIRFSRCGRNNDDDVISYLLEKINDFYMDFLVNYKLHSGCHFLQKAIRVHRT